MTIGEMTYNEMADELAHHGIKGQKWGVRRFQNTDGSLTAKGRKRYLKSDKSAKAKTSSKAKESSKSEETVEQKKDRILRSKSVKDLYDNSALYDNKELQDAVVRKRNESSLREMLPKKESKINKFLDKVTTEGKKIADAANETARAIENVKKLIKVLSGKKVEAEPDDKTNKYKAGKTGFKEYKQSKQSPFDKTGQKTSGDENDRNDSTPDKSKTRDLLESGSKIAGLLETSRSVASVLDGGSGSPKSGGGGILESGKKVAGLLTSGNKNINSSYSKADKERMRTKTWVDLGNGIFDTGDVLNTKSSTATTSSSYNSGKQAVSGYLTSGYASLPASTASTAVELWRKRD